MTRNVGAITARHIDALNHLLHVQTRNTEELRDAFEGFRYVSPRAEEHLGTFSERALAASKEVPEFHRFQEERRRLLHAVRRARLAAEKLHDEARRRLGSTDSDLCDGFGDIYLDSEHWIRFLRYLSLVLDDTSADRQRSWLDEGKEHWLDIAESLKVLINLKDERFRLRRAGEIARERLGRESTHSLKASNRDIEAARWETMSQAHDALKSINDYLDAAGVSFRLLTDHLSRPHILIEELDRATGVRPFGLFATLFLPFIDYLRDPNPRVGLGVCAQIACEAVFERSARPKSPFCSPKCER